MTHELNWIKWNGDENGPVDESTPVFVQYANGRICFSYGWDQWRNWTMPVAYSLDVPKSYVAPHWRAAKGEKYWWVGSDLRSREAIETGHSTDYQCYENGNYFRTKEQAEECFEKVKEIIATFHKANP